MFFHSDNALEAIKEESIPLLKIYRDPFLIFFVFLLLILLLVGPLPVSRLPSFIHWQAIAALAGLLIVTKGLQLSGWVNRLALKLVQEAFTERWLWMFMILFAACSAMVLTNDVALFLVIPFTLELASEFKFDVKTLLILEVIAVNSGSLLTPFGNSQNIYLWQKFNLSMADFVIHMLPVALILLGLLLTNAFFLSKNRKINPKNKQITPYGLDTPLALRSVLLLAGYLTAHSFGWGGPFVIAIIILFLFFNPRLMLSVDWPLLLLFILLFMDIGLLSHFSFVQISLANVDMSHNLVAYTAGIVCSQFMSNVPATLLLSKFADSWYALAVGVALGLIGLPQIEFAVIHVESLRDSKL